ncbi:raqprd family integrative conjugative element protein [Luteimonas sp. XNQY3]|nr:RAQPRD family integrative conjugative element protein [Luteimonas sp. XNQY3]MCD9007471.1 raqprd family integrative conjugative element protein [Luteimonas sp. XNQY3]
MAFASRPDRALRLPAALLGLALSGVAPASASSIATEREQLAALVRQLDMADRIAEQAARAKPEERARYHLDYVRLRADIERVRTGVRDYLVPQRAQPRDPVPLSGAYTRDQSDDAGSDQEPRSP